MIRAAFATGDGININRHFGVADRFDIYEIDTESPTCQDLEEVRAEAGKYLEVFRHCQHCRADSLGIPGKGKDLHNELYKDRKERAADTFSHG